MAGDAGPYPTQVRVDRVGPWNVELVLPSPAGAVSIARIPITVTAPLGDPAEPARSILYALAALLGLAGVAVVVLARGRLPRVSTAAVRAAGPATLAALAAAVTLSVVRLLPSASAGSTPVQLPAVNVDVSVLGGPPRPGRAATVRLALTDGSTGQPVDDLVPAHGALMHVALIGDGPRDFAHLHPGRGTAGAPGGLGVRLVGGLGVDVRATGPLLAGEPVGLSVTVTDRGRPAALDHWLGMAGHLMVRDRATGLFAHLHAIGPMTMVPTLAGAPARPLDPIEAGLRPELDRSAASAGGGKSMGPGGMALESVVRFAYTFPVAGRYDAWLQFRCRGRVLTVPMRLVVHR